MKDGYVAMEKHICRVCGCTYDSGNILLHKKLHPISEEAAVTGMGLCEEHQRLFDEGYVALISIDEDASEVGEDTTHVKDTDVVATGRVLHILRSVAKEMFNIDIPEETPIVCTDDQVIDMLLAMGGVSED
jgi:hypothetical protein